VNGGFKAAPNGSCSFGLAVAKHRRAPRSFVFGLRSGSLSPRSFSDWALRLSPRPSPPANRRGRPEKCPAEAALGTPRQLCRRTTGAIRHWLVRRQTRMRRFAKSNRQSLLRGRSGAAARADSPPTRARPRGGGPLPTRRAQKTRRLRNRARANRLRRHSSSLSSLRISSLGTVTSGSVGAHSSQHLFQARPAVDPCRPSASLAQPFLQR
jgi:hypothetical protein